MSSETIFSVVSIHLKDRLTDLENYEISESKEDIGMEILKIFRKLEDLLLCEVSFGDVSRVSDILLTSMVLYYFSSKSKWEKLGDVGVFTKFNVLHSIIDDKNFPMKAKEQIINLEVRNQEVDSSSSENDTIDTCPEKWETRCGAVLCKLTLWKDIRKFDPRCEDLEQCIDRRIRMLENEAKFELFSSNFKYALNALMSVFTGIISFGWLDQHFKGVKIITSVVTSFLLLFAVFTPKVITTHFEVPKSEINKAICPCQMLSLSVIIAVVVCNGLISIEDDFGIWRVEFSLLILYTLVITGLFLYLMMEVFLCCKRTREDHKEFFQSIDIEKKEKDGEKINKKKKEDDEQEEEEEEEIIVDRGEDAGKKMINPKEDDNKKVKEKNNEEEENEGEEEGEGEEILNTYSPSDLPSTEGFEENNFLGDEDVSILHEEDDEEDDDDKNWSGKINLFDCDVKKETGEIIPKKKKNLNKRWESFNEWSPWGGHTAGSTRRDTNFCSFIVICLFVTSTLWLGSVVFAHRDEFFCTNLGKKFIFEDMRNCTDDIHSFDAKKTINDENEGVDLTCTSRGRPIKGVYDCEPLTNPLQENIVKTKHTKQDGLPFYI